MRRSKTRLEHADSAVTGTAAPARDTLPVRVLGALSELADQPPLISICAAAFVGGLVARDGRLARAGGRMLAAELLATQLKSLVKHRVDRSRPHVEQDGGRYRMQQGDDPAPEANSFPSGHTAGAVAVARALAREYPDHTGTAYAVAAPVAAVQIPRCQHYPTDLAAGAAIGLAAEQIVHLSERALARALAR